MRELPPGWTSESFDGWPGFVIINAPQHGMVTVDYHARLWRGGCTFASPNIDGRLSAGGRGWRERLESEAITWLATAIGIPTDSSGWPT